MDTGKLIKELRIKKGLTQEELAHNTELTARTIQRIENGEVDPRAYTLQMIAKALDVDISILTETYSQENSDTNQENERIWLALIHLSGLFLLYFPTLLIWNRKKYKIEDIKKHFQDVITYQLTNWILFILPGLFIYLMIKIPFIIYLGVIQSGIFFVINAIKVLNEKPYKYPLSIRFKDKNGKSKLMFK